MAVKASSTSKEIDIEAELLSALALSLQAADPERTTNEEFRQLIQQNQPGWMTRWSEPLAVFWVASALFLGNPDPLRCTPPSR
jgi:hypothetical protein